MSSIPDLIPVQRLKEHVYCKRLFYLEYVQGQFETNHFVAEGEYVHRVADQVKGDISEDQSINSNKANSISIGSPRFGLTGVADVIEQSNGKIVLVEFKRGKPMPDGGPWETHKIQACALVLLLRDNGYKCDNAQVYYAQSKQRVDVPVTDELVDRTLQEYQELRKTAALSEIPPPLRASPKCPGCSLVGICMPDETNLHTGITEQKPRRLVPRDSAARPLYVTERGSKVGFRRGRIVVSKEEEKLQEARLIDVSQICLYGNVQATSQLMRTAFQEDIPVCWFSYGGWFQGIATGLPSKNVDLRRRQSMLPPEECLSVAKEMVKGKIRNSRTFLMRNSRCEVKDETSQLRHLVNKVDSAENFGSLLGMEGAAARTYFGAFAKMFNTEALGTFEFNGRNRRPPKDPVNCILSYCYSLLTKDITAATMGVGLDPYLGVFHQPRFGRPALALDLAEEFRPIVADSVVLNLINNGEINPKHFIQRAGGVAFTDDGRKAVLSSYERRIESEIKHPVYEYRITYRRAFELQSRVLAAHITGELPKYEPLVTR